MNKEISKKAFREAEQELEEKEIGYLKQVIKKTLKRINDIENLIKELQEEKKILKLDIDDLKEGRLDRIEERQEKDDKAKKTSVATVTKEVHHHYDRWYQPYVIRIVEPSLPVYPSPLMPIWATTNTDCGGNTLTIGEATSSFTNTSSDCFTITASCAKNNTIGTYLIEDKTIHLR